ncbi:MAG: hypothetical protein H6712_03815 [Myxococcales bacterium]|nr:hypothetical protein [Myxococcales bacterium]MCB9712953.1 hypothetical protein [Myxococcales bacterium]
MSARSLLLLLPLTSPACTRGSEPSSPPEPVTEVAAPELDDEPSTEPAAADDPLTGLHSERAETPPRPEAIEVLVDAVITKDEPGAKVIEVGADARFTIFMKIEKVEPETPLLVPDRYAVIIHSPSKTFRGPVPNKGSRVRFHLKIFPEDPNDPHDETFYSDLWID